MGLTDDIKRQTAINSKCWILLRMTKKNQQKCMKNIFYSGRNQKRCGRLFHVWVCKVCSRSRPLEVQPSALSNLNRNDNLKIKSCFQTLYDQLNQIPQSVKGVAEAATNKKAQVKRIDLNILESNDLLDGQYAKAGVFYSSILSNIPPIIL